MKKQQKGFESYPAWIVLINNLVSVSIYFSGLYLLYLIWPLFAILFLFYMLYLEISIYRKSCVYCYYYGKTCSFGRGRIAGLFFRKGDPKKFCEKSFMMEDLIPSSLVTVIPIVAGIYLLIQGFNWLVLVLMVWPLIIMFLGNPIIYGRLSCIHCKQRKLGCPACEFFMKKDKAKKKVKR